MGWKSAGSKPVLPESQSPPSPASLAESSPYVRLLSAERHAHANLVGPSLHVGRVLRPIILDDLQFEVFCLSNLSAPRRRQRHWKLDFSESFEHPVGQPVTQGREDEPGHAVD